MYYKGHKHNKEDKAKAKASHYKSGGISICLSCEKKYNRYSKIQKVCSRKCQLAYAKSRYKKLEKEDPVRFKATVLFSTVRLGKGKKDISYKLLSEALDKNCKYCEEIITLENASVDHKNPRKGSKVYDRKKRKMTFTKEEIRLLDNKKNLQIICRDCNQTKGNLSHKEFEALLVFLNQHPEMKKKLFNRLKLTRVFFGRR